MMNAIGLTKTVEQRQNPFQVLVGFAFFRLSQSNTRPEFKGIKTSNRVCNDEQTFKYPP